MSLALEKSLADRVSGILLEYVPEEAQQLPLSHALSLRDDLAIDSLSLVALVLRVGDECGVNVVDSGFNLSALLTVGDLFQLAQSLIHEPRSIA
jgi:acyl carrier protein